MKYQKNTYTANSDYVVYAGSLVEQKGIKELIESWKKSNVNLKLLIIGTGQLKKEFTNKYSSENIEFLGFIENEKAIDLIKNSRAVITAQKCLKVNQD